MKTTNGRYVNLLIRLVILGALVFAAITYIPPTTTTISNEQKLLIALLVVVTYSVLDVLGFTLMAIRDKTCQVVC